MGPHLRKQSRLPRHRFRADPRQTSDASLELSKLTGDPLNHANRYQGGMRRDKPRQRHPTARGDAVRPGSYQRGFEPPARNQVGRHPIGLVLVQHLRAQSIVGVHKGLHKHRGIVGVRVQG